jgi:hypothetical protein
LKSHGLVVVSQDSSQRPRVAGLFLGHERLPYPAAVEAAEVGRCCGWWRWDVLTGVDGTGQLPETLGILYTWFIVYQLVVEFCEMYCWFGQSVYFGLAHAEW